MKVSKSIIKLGPRARAMLRAAFGACAVAALALSFAAYLTVDLIRYRPIHTVEIRVTLLWILGIVGGFWVPAAVTLYVAKYYVGIALHYLSLEELRTMANDARAGRTSAGLALALAVAPVVLALLLDDTTTIVLAAVAFVLQVVPYMLATQLMRILEKRELHILKIVRNEHHGSSTTIKALKAMKGPGSTLTNLRAQGSGAKKQTGSASGTKSPIPPGSGIQKPSV